MLQQLMRLSWVIAKLVLVQLLLITRFAGAVCAGDRIRHDHQHCAKGARLAERVRPR